MRILLVGDASNCHSALAKGLRRLGHEVAVASDGSTWMQTDRDYDLTRPWSGKAGGMTLWLKAQWLMRRYMTGWDVVAIASPNFLSLRPHRIKTVFDFLRRHNGSIFLTYLGSDPYWIDFCLDPDMLRYNEWRIGQAPAPLAVNDQARLKAWRDPALRRHVSYIYDNVNGAVTVLYEYQKAAERYFPVGHVAYGGIPIDTDAMTVAHGDEVPRCMKIFVGVHRHRMVEKGTDRMYAAAKRVAARHPDKCRIEYVENVPYREYVERMRSSHILVDQLYSYTPATSALLGMAQGLVAWSGGEPEYYDFIGEYDNRPVMNALPDDESLYASLEDMVCHPERFPELSRRSREFVERHNNSVVVAQRFLDFWQTRI